MAEFDYEVVNGRKIRVRPVETVLEVVYSRVECALYIPFDKTSPSIPFFAKLLLSLPPNVPVSSPENPKISQAF